MFESYLPVCVFGGFAFFFDRLKSIHNQNHFRFCVSAVFTAPDVIVGENKRKSLSE